MLKPIRQYQMSKLKQWFIKAGYIEFILSSWLSLTILSIATNGLIELFDIQIIEWKAQPEKESIRSYILIIVVVPFLETLLFQKLVYRILIRIKYFRNHILYIFIISASAFAITHYYSAVYLIYAFIIGLFLIYSYHARRKKHAFVTVFIIHALFNTTIDLILTLAGLSS